MDEDTRRGSNIDYCLMEVEGCGNGGQTGRGGNTQSKAIPSSLDRRSIIIIIWHH